LICYGLIVIISSIFEPRPPAEEEAAPSWSPDGQQLAFECYLDGPTTGVGEGDRRSFTSDAADICAIGSDGLNRVRLVSDPGGDHYPVWSPDGTQIAYSRRDGIYLINASGTNKRQLVQLTDRRYPEAISRTAWSPNGNHLLFSACLKGSDCDIYFVEVNTGMLTNLTAENGLQDTHPMWTLHGTKIVFWSTPVTDIDICFRPWIVSCPHQLRVINVNSNDERLIYNKEVLYIDRSVSNTGQIVFVSDLLPKVTPADYRVDSEDHLYKIAIDETEPKRLVSATRLFPWSPDGRHLVYENGRLLMIEPETEAIREVTPRIVFFDGTPSWSPNGQQIAMTDRVHGSSEYAERHIFILDIQDGSIHPLVPEWHNSKVSRNSFE